MIGAMLLYFMRPASVRSTDRLVVVVTARVHHYTRYFPANGLTDPDVF